MERLINSDCFDHLKSLSKDDNVSLVVTDPPYLHNKGGGKTPATGKNSHIAKSGIFNFGSEMMAEMSDFTDEHVYLLLDELKRIMVKMNCYIFCNDTLLPYYTTWANLNRKKFTVLVWQKQLSILNRNRFSQDVEYIVRIYDNGTALNKLNLEKYPHKSEYYSKVMKIKGVSNKVHPTQKPVPLIERLLELNGNVGDVVLDPFMGSGSTGIACVNLKRDFIGIEITEKYFKVASDMIDASKNTLFNLNGL